VTNVYLVRHAEAGWSPDEMRPLTAEGREQARAVADALVPLGPDAIYSSPYTRARQTVEPLAARIGLPIHEVEDFRERILTHVAVPDFVAASRTTWDDFAYAFPDGESNGAAQQRGRAAFERLVQRHQGDRIVIATHGTLLTLILNAFDPRLGFEFWCAMSTPDIYRVEIEPPATRRVARLRSLRARQ
jgi:2,3-bisphosphoglycerate-dependent phosphoglycerate mutase